MTKWHIRDDLNHGRAACAPHGQRDLIIDINDWVQRINSDKCGQCAKVAAGRIRQAAYEAANAKYPLSFVTDEQE